MIDFAQFAAQALVLIEKIPATFWGVLIGSFFSLGGVVLSNRANLKRLREQFKHDRLLRAKERELALRKEVYLEVANAISAANECIARMGDLELSHNEIVQPYASKAGAFAKFYVIGGEKALEALAALVGEVAAVMLRMSSRRFALLGQRQQVVALNTQIQRSHAEIDRYLELMKQQNIEGSGDQRRWDVLNQNIEFEHRQIESFTQQVNSLVADLKPKHIQFMRDCVNEVHRLWDFIIPALVEVRRELEMPIDEVACKEIFRINAEKGKAALAEFTGTL